MPAPDPSGPAQAHQCRWRSPWPR